jgi:hypothetical protein
MPKAALVCAVAAFTALSSALSASGGDAAPKPGLRDALLRTMHAPAVHYAMHVRMHRGDTPLALHVRGQANARTISVRMRMNDLELPDGSKVPGPSGAALLDGPFLYERAPNGIVVQGTLRWLRLSVAHLSSASEDLKAVHALTPSPLLRVVGQSHTWQAGAHLYRGTVAYDDPIVRSSLARLTGGLEFRHLRLSVYVGRDRRVHRILITGRTADRKTTLVLSARLYGFGHPLHVSPPKPGTFMDEELAQLAS